MNRPKFSTSKFNGKAWKQNRKFLLSVFEDLGFGRPSIEDHIMAELQELVCQLSNTMGCLINVKDYITASVSNIIAAVMFGSRFDAGEAKHKCLVKHLKNILDGSEFGLTVETKPKWLSKVMSSLPLNRPEVKRESWLAIRELVREKIAEHKNTLNPDFNRDFIDGYLQKMREHHADPSSPFSEENLQEHTAEFLLSGTGPLSMRIFWVLHICAQNPNSVQSKIQKEIDDVVGRHRPPTWEDRKEMPFTLASLKEALRWISVGTIGCSRSVPEDTIIGDYFIPKGSIALINVRAVLRNPVYWSNPDDFDPTRFLTNDGDKLEKKVDAFIPFGVGKRSCPGQSLAIVEMFLYIATLLQKFNVFPEYRDQLVNIGSANATADTFVQRLRFVLR
ncbi:cytochrome P450 2J2-like [Ixodes scapularis]|uniref:cytochrome P450 2J2-like n=1 Tax=Ixodes scapularis TaxID=6945 RepID=UPI001C3876E2|nr:cytochrome P450 2J2-like [Ixodes scapularis]